MKSNNLFKKKRKKKRRITYKKKQESKFALTKNNVMVLSNVFI